MIEHVEPNGSFRLCYRHPVTRMEYQGRSRKYGDIDGLNDEMAGIMDRAERDATPLRRLWRLLTGKVAK